MVRIAGLVQQDNFGMSSAGANGALLNDPSSMSFKRSVGANDGIRTTKAFLTSVTPSKAPNLKLNEDITAADFLSDQDSPRGAKKTKRKIFGANDYLERQKKLGKGRNSIQPTATSPALQSSEYDEEFKEMHNNMSASLQK